MAISALLRMGTGQNSLNIGHSIVYCLETTCSFKRTVIIFCLRIWDKGETIVPLRNPKNVGDHSDKHHAPQRLQEGHVMMRFNKFDYSYYIL